MMKDKYFAAKLLCLLMFIGYHFSIYEDVFNASYLRCVAIQEARVEISEDKKGWRYVPVVVYVSDEGEEFRVFVLNKQAIRETSLQHLVGTDMRVVANMYSAYYAPIWKTIVETLLLVLGWLFLIKHYVNKIKNKIKSKKR